MIIVEWTVDLMIQTAKILQRLSLALYVLLPVGGGTGFEDVLFGREQREAVGIKVDFLRVHDGKRFRTTAAFFSSLVPTVFGVGVSAGGKSHSGAPRPTKAVEVCRFMQGGFKFQSGAMRCALGVEETATALFVQSQSSLSFHPKAPPPVERVERIVTSRAV